MPKARHSDDQIRRKLRQAEATLAGGASISDVCHELDISEATYHRWRKKYNDPPGRDGQPGRAGGSKEDPSKRLKELEKENKRLKQLVGQLMLDNAFLKDAFEARHRR